MTRFYKTNPIHPNCSNLFSEEPEKPLKTLNADLKTDPSQILNLTCFSRKPPEDLCSFGNSGETLFRSHRDARRFAQPHPRLASVRAGAGPGSRASSLAIQEPLLGCDGLSFSWGGSARSARRSHFREVTLNQVSDHFLPRESVILPERFPEHVVSCLSRTVMFPAQRHRLPVGAFLT